VDLLLCGIGIPPLEPFTGHDTRYNRAAGLVGFKRTYGEKMKICKGGAAPLAHVVRTNTWLAMRVW
jgi:hypothetical protein